VLVAVAGLAAVLLLGVWLVPQWLDWTRYRATIEALASATLGQPVTISGSISLTLLPEPELTAANVNIGGRGPDDLSIRVAALRLRVALWPLIGGHVDARELVLRGPDLRIPWPQEPGTLRPRPPAWLAAFAARIENGRLTVGRLAFTGIDATLATLDTGALLASGTGQFGGQDWHFTARLTAAGPDGAAGLNVTLDGQVGANGIGASFAGQFAQDGTFAGTVAGRGPNLAVLLPTPPVPFRADGRLVVGAGLVAVNDLTLEIGGSPVRGAVALRVAPSQRLDVALAASRLDLDAWLPVLLRAGNTIAGIDVPIGIDVSAEAAPLAGGTFEHVRAAFDVNDKDLVVREASALLPGSGTLQLRGRIARDDPAHARFDGDARLYAPLLRTTLRWLEKALPGWLPPHLLTDLPDSVAQRAELSAHVVVGGGEAALRQIVGMLDDAPVAGSLGFKWGEPPAFTADLSLDRLTLDQWLPPRPDLADLSRPVSGLDAELRFTIRQATLAGTTIDGLAIDAAIEAGAVLLRRIEGTARDAHITLSGMLGGGRLGGGRLGIETKDATKLAELLPAAWRATPALWQGPARLDVQIAGPPEALVVDVGLSLADARLEASPILDLKSGRWSSALTLRHPGARRLIATLGLPDHEGLSALPAWLGDGSLSLVAHLVGEGARFAAESFDLTAAMLHAIGDLALDLRSGEPLLSGRVDTDAVTLPLPNGAATLPLPLGILHGWRGNVQLGIGQLAVGTGPTLRDATATLSVADDRLRLTDFAAKLGSGTVTGSITVDAAAKPPALAVEVRVGDALIAGPLSDAPIDLLSGHADASMRLAASGYSPSAILATLDGRVTLTVHDGTMSGFDLFRLKQAIEKSDPKSVDSAASDALRSGATGFDLLDVSANIAHGDLVLETGSMNGIAGEAHVSGGMNLVGQTLDVRIALQPALPSPPEVAIHLTGPIEQPKRATELAGLARWMAALVH
jgi:hypothetical protein